jgi:hypothetical protein
MISGAVACPYPEPGESSSHPPITSQDTFEPFGCGAGPHHRFDHYL